MIDLKNWCILHKKGGKINYRNKISPLVSAVFLSTLFLLPTIASAATHYVSTSGSASWANSTNISTPCSISTAEQNADDGDIVYLRAGEYTAQFSPDNSGSSGHPVTWQNYNDETVVFTYAASEKPTMSLSGRDYITLTGLDCTRGSPYFFCFLSNNGDGNFSTGLIVEDFVYNGAGAYMKGVEDFIIRDGTMSNLHKAAVLYSGDDNTKSTQTRTENITVEDCSYAAGCHDAIQWHDSGSDDVGSYHIAVDCDVTVTGTENCFDVTSGDYIVIKDSSCTGGYSSTMIGINGKVNSMSFVRFDNVTLSDGSTGGALTLLTGDDFEGPLQIFNSVYYGANKYLIKMTNSDTVANQIVRIAHNTFDGRGQSSAKNYNHFVESNVGGGVDDVIYKNNIFIYGGTHRAFYWKEPSRADMLADHNLYWNVDSGAGADIWGSNQNLAYVVSNYSKEDDDTPGLFNTLDGGIDANPTFVNLNGNDYTLDSGSPAIDTAGWLATITQATGSGTTFKVDDAYWFYDGWNITGEKGDRIKTENGQIATITQINYGTGAITVDKPISWTNGEGIGFYYESIRPDIGAKESLSGTANISSPTGLRITSN